VRHVLINFLFAIFTKVWHPKRLEILFAFRTVSQVGFMFFKIFRFFHMFIWLFYALGLHAESAKLEYGGISFSCYRGCGIPEYDGDAYEIICSFYQIKNQVDDLYYSSLREGWTNLRTDDWYKETAYKIYDEYDDYASICRRQRYFSRAFELLRKEFQEKEIEYYKFLKNQVALHEQNIRMIQSISQTHSLFEYKNGRVIGPGNAITGFDVVSFLQHERELLDFTAQELSGVNDFSRLRIKLDETYLSIDALLKEIFFFCLENHQAEGITFRNAAESLLQKEYFEAIDWLRQLITILERESFSPNVIGKVHLLTGQLQSEYGQYANAIESLTEAIAKCPNKRDAYLERATAYFELGDFEKAVEDYLRIDPDSIPKQARLNWQQTAEIGLGLTAGILEGIGRGSVEFLPEILNSAHGLSHGLWACCSNPVGASKTFVKASLSCIEYLRTHSSKEVLGLLVPELRELLEHYDQLGDFQKGHAIGQVIGKYGIDIFLTRGSATMVKRYRDLKRANQVMTLEALASQTEGRHVLREATEYSIRRGQTLKSANLKIQWDKQGKHLEGHRNYDPEGKKSIFKHSDPQKLVKEHAGKGIKVSHADTFPGQPGYKEVVEFNEFIGYSVEKNTGIKTPTNRGTIHYAKDGTHIVPTEPKK
jgi:tetratricopeptide (TPR) repeat protein